MSEYTREEMLETQRKYKEEFALRMMRNSKELERFDIRNDSLSFEPDGPYVFADEALELIARLSAKIARLEDELATKAGQ